MPFSHSGQTDVEIAYEWTSDRANYLEQQIGEMPAWIKNMREESVHVLHENNENIDVDRGGSRVFHTSVKKKIRTGRCVRRGWLNNFNADSPYIKFDSTFEEMTVCPISGLISMPRQCKERYSKSQTCVSDMDNPY